MQYTVEQITRILNGEGLLSKPDAKVTRILTDSRSLLSYPRHHYFRRILCNYLGDMMEKGQMTSDMALVGKVVEDISYNNAKRYFGV